MLGPDTILFQNPTENVYLIKSNQAPQKFDLTSTIKKNQDFLKYVQTMRNAPVSYKQAKQDDLLILKDRCVIPLSVATVPEKTQYQRRLYSNGGDPGLSIVGVQTNTITKTQFKSFITK
jgi:hypothetical protein